MSKIHRLLVAASIMGSSAPVAAQETPLRPQLDDSRLWWSTSSDEAPLPPMPVGFSLPPQPTGSAGPDFAVGYVFGSLLGLGLGERAAPPEELGLYLRGWYRGVAGLERSTARPGPGLDGISALAASTLPGPRSPPVFGGVLKGFLNALATTSRH